MKKKACRGNCRYFAFCLLILCMIINIQNVSAQGVEPVLNGLINEKYSNVANIKEEPRIVKMPLNLTKEYSAGLLLDTNVGCGLIDPELLDYINKIVGYIKIIVPILLILFGGFDFGKAVFSGDNDALKKATSSFAKRCMAAVAIFFLPTIIELLFSLPGIKDLVTDPLCGIK
ncbi:MAG: hypothetical protein RSB99_02090 [Bacilli bacterium]